MGTPAALSPVEDHNDAQHQQQHQQQLARSSKASSSHSSHPEDPLPPSPPTSQQQQQLAPAVSFAPSSNVTAEMRKRGATTTHRGSLPLVFEDMSSLHAITSNTNVNSNTSSRRSSRATDVPAVVLDRRLLQRYEEINSEIAQLSRLSRLDSLSPAPAAPPASSTSTSHPPASNESDVMLRQVTAELRKARRSSSQVIQSQKELLEKLERQEKSSVRRFFSLNKDARVERIKSKLCDKLTEAAQNDTELVRLERQSDALARTSLLASTFNAVPPMSSTSTTASYSANTNSYNSTNGPLSSLPSVAEIDDELATLSREKEDVLNSLFAAIQSSDVQDLHARIASYACEIHACQSIRKQVDRCATMYRQALTALSKALATIVSPQYSGSIQEFAQVAYPLAIEASHLIEAAAHGIQPESRRRYEAFAPALVGLHPPKFPQAVVDYARRARTNSDPHSALALEAMRKLRAAENVLMLLQRLVIEKAEVVDNWKRCVERDQAAAERGHAMLEKRLQEHVAVLARSVSV